MDAAAFYVVAGDGRAARVARRAPLDLDEVAVGVHAFGATGAAGTVYGERQGRRWINIALVMD